MPLIELDTYCKHPVAMMAPVKGDSLDDRLVSACEEILFNPDQAEAEGRIEWLDRFAFYERSASAFAIVVTGETRKYGNVLLKKGVIEASQPPV